MCYHAPYGVDSGFGWIYLARVEQMPEALRGGSAECAGIGRDEKRVRLRLVRVHGIADDPPLFIAIGDAKCIANGGTLRRKHCGCVLKEEMDDEVRADLLHNVGYCRNGEEKQAARAADSGTTAQRQHSAIGHRIEATGQ